MNEKLLQNYREILLEVSDRTSDRDIMSNNINIDLWDILAAAFLAAFITVSALGAGWVSYYIIISLTSTITFSSGIGIGATSIEWLKVKENRLVAQKKLKDFLNGNFAQEIKDISIQTIKVLHSSIKNKLIDLFGNDPDEFEKFIKLTKEQEI
jgi:hypothetical protein